MPAKKKNTQGGLMYKGKPLLRRGNLLYYGNPEDKYIYNDDRFGINQKS